MTGQREPRPAARGGRPGFHIRDRLRAAAGGRLRLRIIVILAAVLALASADQATVGAIAAQLEHALHIGNTDIGFLITAAKLAGIVTTLPFGILTDRINRKHLLLVSILAWCAALVASGAAQSYPMLLISRLGLGAVIGAAAPIVASLTGDLFPSAERGRIYGYILAGELLGTGFGLLVSGGIAAATTWRAGFWVLAACGIGLTWAIRGLLPEPARGGQSQLQPGATSIDDAGAAPADSAPQDSCGTHDSRGSRPAPGADSSPRPSKIRREIDEADIDPHADRVLHHDPTGRSIWWAVRYVLSIRTNLVLIIASSLGYFFFAGISTFGVLFARRRFGLDQGGASALIVLLGAGGLVGVLISGRLSDRAIRRHRVSARPVIGGLCFVIASALFLPALLSAELIIAGPLLILAAVAIGGANPPLDAARLDIMHSRLWGRAESVRTVLRTAVTAAAPLAFGYLSSHLAGGAGQHGVGLSRAYLVMLVPLVAAGLIVLLLARRTYPRDVATAIASERATAEHDNCV